MFIKEIYQSYRHVPIVIMFPISMPGEMPRQLHEALQYTQSLPLDQQSALQLWTNPAHRAEKIAEFLVVSQLDLIMEKSPPLRESVVVYRGADVSEHETHRHAFISTTPHIDRAHDDYGVCLLEVTIPVGTKVLVIANGYDEVLLPRWGGLVITGDLSATDNWDCRKTALYDDHSVELCKRWAEGMMVHWEQEIAYWWYDIESVDRSWRHIAVNVRGLQLADAELPKLTHLFLETSRLALETINFNRVEMKGGIEKMARLDVMKRLNLVTMSLVNPPKPPHSEPQEHPPLRLYVMPQSCPRPPPCRRRPVRRTKPRNRRSRKQGTRKRK